MELRNARVALRPWRRQDDAVADSWPPYDDPFDSIWNLPRQYNWTSEGWLSFESGSRRSWAVEDRYGRLIGRISLREIDTRQSQARLGITLGSPFVSQGLGTDSLRLFLDYYFSDLGFEAMVLDVAAPNQRAVRCYERLGFQRVGSDWRMAGYAFDARVLDAPHYRSMRRFFRTEKRGLQVEFFEMRLERRDWLALRAAGS